MSMSNMLQVFVLFAFLFNFQDCSKNKVNEQEIKSGKSMISGNFTAKTKNTPGFLKLEINEDGSVKFLNVVTLHNPPAEIERLESKLIEEEGKLCFEDKPKTIGQCFVSYDDDAVTVKLDSDSSELKLKKVK